ncbi:MAG TPA: undecaprenyl-diphosphate phosphatase [Petrimonas sp.]|uniref:undecaprenyl-diphosphate phosphatase n=1 Tax=Petrimonas sp. TaxID=2023866 RepID=UPI000966ADB5|nr:undecaprenyl-diphosphate phosphatase [Petrimonas sp.]MEA4980538.1 undecaprenyl-diphosphate phosphatase [Petrimonas sp.]MEA5046776.1 undecaprenyl-diphosphate phosphatase [Petrimonas sp.]OJV36379.1 MAG: undecaprenyl-diphosphatase UppP [Bacteroidia bacterium 43-41]HHV84551.1 undecaprenyl-diphosphate phosphatase [Petrimonas sp.]
MSSLEAIIIAIVEGLTEFLPVSSTGHMIITQALLGIESTPFVKAFTVIIQFGAILSVVFLYWKRFFRLNRITVFDKSAVVGMSFVQKGQAFLKRFLHKFDFYWKLFIAVIPAGVLGLIFGDQIDSLLENVFVVSVMLVIGGVVMLFVDKWFNKPGENQSISWQRALKIGFFQCIAMIPGVSRSMATIVGGMSTKLDRKNAAEFSFFLAVPTMAAAAGYKLYKLIGDPLSASMLQDNIRTLIIGNVVAFVVAVIAIRFFIDFLTKHGFKAFGWYRIIVGILLIVLLLSGTVSNIA